MTGTGALRARIDLPGRLVGEIDAGSGEVVAVIGPNGAGKSTLVEAIAGTLGGVGADIRYGDQDWTGLPVHRRNVGLVFQDALLFPHLDALANTAFGLRVQGVRRRAAAAQALDWLTRLGVAGQAHQHPDSLSGGQAQRVALARALARTPDVLLLDEPFAALDVSVAIDLRTLLADHLRTFAGSTVLVTHDSLDVHALADQVVVLEDGRVAQTGSPAEIAEAPLTRHAARLLGLNVLSVETLVVPGTHPPGTLASFEPSTVTLTRDEPVGSARNRWPTRVRTAVERAGVVRVHLVGEPGATVGSLYADVTAAAAADLGLEPGRAVWASVKATEVRVFTVPHGSNDR